MERTHSGGSRGIRAVLPLLMCFLVFPLGSVSCGDIVKLKGGKEVQGKIISVTEQVVVVQLDQGTLKIPRYRVLSITMEQDEFLEPPVPPDSSGRAGPGGSERRHSDETVGPVTEKRAASSTGAAETEESETGRIKAAKPDNVNNGKVTEEPKGETGKPKGTDEAVEKFLKRYIWLLPEGTGNRIGLGMGILFIFTMILHFASRLADVEEPSLPRSMILSIGVLSMVILELAVGAGRGWPIWACFLGVDILAWYTACKILIREGFWKSTLMLVFTSFAVLLCVLWVEVAGYILSI